MKQVFNRTPGAKAVAAAVLVFVAPVAVAQADRAQARVQAPAPAKPAVVRDRLAGDPEGMTTVVISASPLGLIGGDMISPVTAIGGNELMRLRESTLGDTLGTQRGISSSHFGAGASRPIIRGMDGPRVKILSDGAEVQDASTISPDHAVGFEPMLAERIEVLRGPSALAYGGGAIGGVVNVLDRKIPTRMPEQAVEGSVELRGNSGARERGGVFEVTGAAGNFAVHAEGVKRNAHDYQVGKDWPGGRHVAGSFRDSASGSVGLSWIGVDGYLGAAFTKERADYGIPGHEEAFLGCHPDGGRLECGHEEEEHEEEEGHLHGEGVIPTVRLDSKRWDLRGEYRAPQAFIRKVRLRSSFTDYRHDEMEQGDILTTFSSKGHDARLEFEHAPIGAMRGVVGMQSTRRDFSAVGEESYLSPSLTKKYAVFITEEMRAGSWRFEGAARHEWQDIDVRNPTQANTSANGTSASVGAVWRFAPQYSLRASLSHSNRLPTAEELYAEGVHLATNTYELGNANLGKETSRNIDLTLRKFEGNTTFSFGLYRNRVGNFIYANTLDVFEGFQLIQYAQRDAVFTGIDAELKHKFSPVLSATIYGDSVRARFDGGGNLPRIPAQRIGAKLDGDWQAWHGFVEFYRVRGQDRVTAFESPTPGYNMLNAGMHTNARVGGVPVQFFARLNNLTDALAYSHSSFIKGAAPLMGRSLTAGMRMSF